MAFKNLAVLLWSTVDTTRAVDSKKTVKRFNLRKQAFNLLILILVITFGTGFPLDAQESQPQSRESAWSSKVIELAATLPVQDGGRVKPLDTVARFKLLKLNGRRTCYSLDGERLSPIEWLLDCLFRPELATKYKVFLVQNNAVLDAAKISHDGKKKRDRYAYIDLLPGRDNLYVLANEYVKIDEKERDAVQAQVVHLAENLVDFEWLTHYLDFARETYAVDSNPELGAVLGGSSPKHVSDILKNSKKLKDYFLTLQRNGSNLETADRNSKIDQIGKLLSWVDEMGNRSAALALFPPGDLKVGSKEWLTPGDIVNAVFSDAVSINQHIHLLKLVESSAQLLSAQQQFEEKFTLIHAGIKELAEARGEYGKIPLEVTFYKCQFFYYALLIYIVGFLLLAVSWLRPRGTILNRLTLLALIGATLFLAIGITIRCIIRSRPPVSTLYETILFVTAVSVVVSLVIEFINKQKIGLAIGSLLGLTGTFLANKYEIKEGSDTMTSLVAVLDSNYWLSMHVTTVTIGYAAGLLACAMAHTYILCKLIGVKKGNSEFYKGISGMVYGILCFGLFFSVVGTILGGIWANDSWGRFWGWDPKENGALMIILAELAILHARMGRYIRDLGICMSAIAVGCIIAFSWWGVNLLGVGLHSYGWTSGVFNSLLIYYSLEVLVLFAGMLVWHREQRSLYTTRTCE